MSTTTDSTKMFRKALLGTVLATAVAYKPAKMAHNYRMSYLHADYAKLFRPTQNDTNIWFQHNSEHVNKIPVEFVNDDMAYSLINSDLSPEEIVEKYVGALDNSTNETFVREVKLALEKVVALNPHCIDLVPSGHVTSMMSKTHFYPVIGAGCIFTNGNHVLAGLQKKKGEFIISGIGGTRESDETFDVNAIRETVEELFDISNVDATLIKKICDTLHPKDRFLHGGYGVLVYDFDQLVTMLRIVKDHATDASPVYRTFPSTIDELILKRVSREDSEINTLYLLPVIENVRMDDYFLQDIDRVSQIRS